MDSLLNQARQFVFSLLLFHVLLCPTVCAQDIINPTETILEQAGAEEEPIRKQMLEGVSFGGILSDIGNLFLCEIRTMSKGFPLLFLVLIFYGIKNCMEFPYSLDRTVSLGCFSVTALTAGQIFGELTQSAQDMLTHLSKFVYLTIPALTGVIANGGRVLTAAKSTYFILGFINLLTFAIEKFF